ncbi:hypothetical protein FA13DRAFT_709358 [Coprinellus micaceus]|uniref:CBM1 domain-containing protein n=1 Tax=Coprinellus micaceus TaxID=71717 RepID=A0A4Y7TV62_COPMI|nr:hypothetical protein FA13DRAFT_709358 [Coprinellus micaceus]
MQYRAFVVALAMASSAFAGVVTASAPATTTTFVPAPLPVVQCGGVNWAGPTACDRPKYYCVKFNDYYSECLHESRLPEWGQGQYP